MCVPRLLGTLRETGGWQSLSRVDKKGTYQGTMLQLCQPLKLKSELLNLFAKVSIDQLTLTIL